MNNTKIIKAAKITDRILNIAQKILLVVSIIAAVSIILVFAEADLIIADSSSISIGNLTLELAESAVPDKQSLRTYIVTELAAFIIIAGALWYFIRILRSIIVSMKDGRPFETGVSSKIRKLAWVSLAVGAIINIGRGVCSIALMNAYDLHKLLDPDTVIHFTYNYMTNMDYVFVFGILFFLSLIFRYGENLQSESDETL